MSESFFIGGDNTFAELLDERLVKRVQLEVGEDRCQTLPPEPELPVTKHVRRHRWTDHVEGLLQPLPQRPFERQPCPLEGHGSSEVRGRKLLNAEALALILKPSTERELLNRANARMTIFEKDEDYEAFERILEEAVDRTRTRLLTYCVMPNHWHFIVWPRQDGELSRFVGWLTLTHTQRWHAHRHTRGSGHVYQGRFNTLPTMFKSAPQGGANKRGRTDSIHDANLLYSNLDAFHQGTDDLSPFMPACGGQAGLHPLPEVLEAL